MRMHIGITLPLGSMHIRDSLHVVWLPVLAQVAVVQVAGVGLGSSAEVTLRVALTGLANLQVLTASTNLQRNAASGAYATCSLQLLPM